MGFLCGVCLHRFFDGAFLVRFGNAVVVRNAVDSCMMGGLENVSVWSRPGDDDSSGRPVGVKFLMDRVMSEVEINGSESIALRCTHLVLMC